MDTSFVVGPKYFTIAAFLMIYNTYKTVNLHVYVGLLKVRGTEASRCTHLC
jgi:hypothetical protein